MGTLLGNIFALILLTIPALDGLTSLKISSIILITEAYFLWLLVLSVSISTKPKKSNPFCNLLNSGEIKIYQKYHLYLWFPSGSEALSALLNNLRLAGLVWGGLCVWKNLYWYGGLSIGYFFISGYLILELNPLLYLGHGARKGNQLAIDHLSLIEDIQRKRLIYNTEEINPQGSNK